MISNLRLRWSEWVWKVKDKISINVASRATTFILFRFLLSLALGKRMYLLQNASPHRQFRLMYSSISDRHAHRSYVRLITLLLKTMYLSRLWTFLIFMPLHLPQNPIPFDNNLILHTKNTILFIIIHSRYFLQFFSQQRSTWRVRLRVVMFLPTFRFAMHLACLALLLSIVDLLTYVDLTDYFFEFSEHFKDEMACLLIEGFVLISILFLVLRMKRDNVMFEEVVYFLDEYPATIAKFFHPLSPTLGLLCNFAAVLMCHNFIEIFIMSHLLINFYFFRCFRDNLTDLSYKLLQIAKIAKINRRYHRHDTLSLLF